MKFQFTLPESCRVVDFEIFRVFSPKLQNTKLWYTLNTSLSGDVPQQRFSESKILNLFPEECRSLQLQELSQGQDITGKFPPKGLNVGNKSRNDVFVGSSFSVLVAAIRRKDARNYMLLCDRFKRILNNKYPRSRLIDRRRTASPGQY